jgi:hypothetical protein
VRSVLAGWLSGTLAPAAAGLVAAQETPSAPPAAPVQAAPSPDVSAPPAVATPPPAAPEVVPHAAVAPAAAPPEPPPPPVEPLKRPRYTAAVLQGVDKITAETLRFEAKVGEPVRYKGLIITVRACETTAADEAITDSTAYLDVQSQPQVAPGRAAAPPRPVFHGWMFASSPTLNPLEHPIYDLWLIACKTATPGV